MQWRLIRKQNYLLKVTLFKTVCIIRIVHLLAQLTTFDAKNRRLYLKCGLFFFVYPSPKKNTFYPLLLTPFALNKKKDALLVSLPLPRTLTLTLTRTPKG